MLYGLLCNDISHDREVDGEVDGEVNGEVDGEVVSRKDLLIVPPSLGGRRR